MIIIWQKYHIVKYKKVLSKAVGFFGKADSATVKNLTVEGNITANMASYVGGNPAAY